MDLRGPRAREECPDLLFEQSFFLKILIKRAAILTEEILLFPSVDVDVVQKLTPYIKCIRMLS